MSVVVVGLSHRTAPLELLERMAMRDERLPKALHDLVSRDFVSEAVDRTVEERGPLRLITAIQGLRWQCDTVGCEHARPAASAVFGSHGTPRFHSDGAAYGR